MSEEVSSGMIQVKKKEGMTGDDDGNPNPPKDGGPQKQTMMLEEEFVDEVPADAPPPADAADGKDNPREEEDKADQDGDHSENKDAEAKQDEGEGNNEQQQPGESQLDNGQKEDPLEAKEEHNDTKEEEKQVEEAVEEEKKEAEGESKEEEKQPESPVKASEHSRNEVDLDEFFGVKNCLTVEMIADNLDSISKTHDGLSFVYTSLDLNKKKLQHLGNALLLYKHLRYITMSNNKIEDISCVAKLPKLVTLDASKNQIKSVDFLGDENDTLIFLNTINLSINNIERLPHLNPPCLTSVHLNGNKISDCSKFKGHNKLEFLELRKNELTNCDGLHKMPNLHTLYLADNKIDSISGLKELGSLKRLHLRKNELSDLSGCPMLPSLQYLNLRETKIEKLEEIAHLAKLEDLKDLNLLGTPLEETLADGLKKEVLIVLEKLKLTRFNKEEVTEDDYNDARELKEERIREEEERRKQAELDAQENQDNE